MSFPQPTTGFKWTSEWRAQLPVVRGIHVPEPEPLSPSAPPLRGFHDFGGGERYLSRIFESPPWVYWGTTAEGVPAQQVGEAVQRAQTAQAWQELLAQACGSELLDYSLRPERYRGWEDIDKARQKQGYPRPLLWMTRQCLERNGVAATLGWVLEMWSMSIAQGWGDWRQQWCFDLLDPVRHAIAAADEGSYREAFAVAEAARSRSPELARVCAHFFPHVAQWSSEWLALDANDSGEYLVQSCVLSPGDHLRYVQRHSKLLRSRGGMAGFLLQLQVHGAASLDSFGFVLRRAMDEDSEQLAPLLAIVSKVLEPRMPALLAEGLTRRRVRTALERLGRQFPSAVLHACMAQASAARNRTAECAVLRLAQQWPAAVQPAIEALDTGPRRRFESIFAHLAQEPAAPASLPSLLRSPPWIDAAQRVELPAFDIAPLSTVETVALPPAELEAALRYTAGTWNSAQREYDALGFPKKLGLTPAGGARLLRGEALRDGDVQPGTASGDSDDVLRSPAAAHVALWNSYPPGWEKSYYYGGMRGLIGRYGAAVLPGVVRHLVQHAGRAGGIARHIDSPDLVPFMMHVMRNVRLHRQAASQWLLAYPRTCCFRALSIAFQSQHSPARDDARHALRWLSQQGHRQVAEQAAQTYGGAMPEALRTLLDTDPLRFVPGAMPPLPPFFVAAACRRPELRGGGLLPVSALEHIAHMLMISLPDSPYAGVAVLREACTPSSLAEFAWDVYEAWEADGAPAHGRWAFAGLGLLGDDETARRLVTRINVWGGEDGMRGRATDALEVLGAIGSDVALSRLNALATKGKHNRVKKRAAELIARVAEQRGLTMDELGDRLAPTFGLEEEGAHELDFGPRKFFLDFDETLAPIVRDGRGLKLKDLPKPVKSDDAEVASLTVERYKLLKKEVKAIASLQVTRMERAMSERRRWRPPEFDRFFVQHPLVRHLAARLVWGTYDDENRLVATFRVAEDRTLASVADEAFELSADANVGIVHPLELGRDTIVGWGQSFADYELLQPFWQLARETYAFTPDEAGERSIDRFLDRDVASGAVIGLAQKGWDRGEMGDGGMVIGFRRYDARGYHVEIGTLPGVFVGGGIHEPRQSLQSLVVSRSDSQPATFADLEPIFASEILRDLDLLNPALAQITT